MKWRSGRRDTEGEEGGATQKVKGEVLQPAAAVVAGGTLAAMQQMRGGGLEGSNGNSEAVVYCCLWVW